MITYDLIDAKGYLVFKDERQKTILVDTGSPSSYLNFKETLGSEMTPWIGVEVDELWGLDKLCNYNILVDTSNRKITFGGDEVQLNGNDIGYYIHHHHMAIKVKVNGVDRNVVFDTGATHSYIDSHWVDTSATATGIVHDCSPIAGEFQAATYLGKIQLGAVEFEADLNVPPSNVKQAFAYLGDHGVFGDVILKNFKVLMDFKNHKLVLA